MITGRCGGKTTEAVRYLREDPMAVMICISAATAKITAEAYPDISPARFISVQNVASLRHRAISAVVVDNADIILQHFLGLSVPIVLATATGHTVRNPYGA